MPDYELVSSILIQIDGALTKISERMERIHSSEDFTDTAAGLEKLDSICMLFLAVGESFKNIDKITQGSFLSKYSDIDWKGVMGFRDVIAHQYFDIDAEQVFWICTHELRPLSNTIKLMIADIRS